MKVNPFVKTFFGRILAPSYLMLIIGVFSDRLSIVFYGVGLSLLIAIALPFLSTIGDIVEVVLHRRHASDHIDRLEAFSRFINAYTAVLTKYPPEVMPASLANSVSNQLVIIMRWARPLKGRNASRHATLRDEVAAMRVTPEDFIGWGVDDCEAFVEEMLESLAHIPLAPLRTALKRFASGDSRWDRHLETAEDMLDRQVQQHLAHSDLVCQIAANPEMRQHVLARLHLEAYHRQTALQTYLQSRLNATLLYSSPREVSALIEYLRYETVSERLLYVLAQEQPLDQSAPATAPIRG